MKECANYVNTYTCFDTRNMQTNMEVPPVREDEALGMIDVAASR